MVRASGRVVEVVVTGVVVTVVWIVTVEPVTKLMNAKDYLGSESCTDVC